MTKVLSPPDTDATPIFELFRGSYGTELLTAAVAHFNVFGLLAKEPRSQESLAAALDLQPRPMAVLLTTLRAMKLIDVSGEGLLQVSKLGERLIPGSPFGVGDYVGLAATAPGVLEMVSRLRTNQPAGMDEDGDGAAFIYREGMKSAMEQHELSEHFTLALAGRAKNVAPVLAEKLKLPSDDGAGLSFLDVGGGTGIYSISMLLRYPKLQATVLDRPEVLAIAARMADEYGVADRMTLQEGDMFESDLPPADIVLLSNILHDWDVPECEQLVSRCSGCLSSGGMLVVHDVLLDDDLGGPLPIALYSAALFTLTEGRAYSAAEYESWLKSAGLTVADSVATAIHCHAITAVK